jgi:type I restriction enzyme, R subunit
MGRNGGAGNPPSWKGFATAYLWERTWSRDSVLDLVEHFAHVVEEEDDKGKKTGRRRLLFPRYHQLDVVRRLVADASEHGTGQVYLIQHSAGSGKSESIAWLAHQLSTLHDAQQRRVFDSIIIITDRRVLDRQLQRKVLAFQQTLGIVENIDTTSRQLKQALEDGKTIIVTTLQKFPVIQDEMGELAGKRFAVIIDEAHSSQSGESTKSLKSVLSVGSLEEAEAEALANRSHPVAEMKRLQSPQASTTKRLQPSRRHPGNVSKPPHPDREGIPKRKEDARPPPSEPAPEPPRGDRKSRPALGFWVCTRERFGVGL